MTQSIQKLSDIEKINLNNAVEFLVPYVHAIVKISSEVDLTTLEFKSKITSLYLEINSEDKGRIEASANHNNFEFFNQNLRKLGCHTDPYLLQTSRSLHH